MVFREEKKYVFYYLVEVMEAEKSIGALRGLGIHHFLHVLQGVSVDEG
jgi:hypothetical protein